MSYFIILMAAILFFFVFFLWLPHFCAVSIVNRSAATISPYSTKEKPIVPIMLTVTLLLMSVIIYSQIGRFCDYNQGFIDENIDYLIAADINISAQEANENPESKIALLNLAYAYMEGGLYAQAVTTLDKLLLIENDAEILGMKANALYYRNDRDMNMEVTIVLSQALALDPYEFQSLLLMATHAYLNKDFEQAIVYWQKILESENPSVNRESINGAILKAEQQIVDRTERLSE